MVLAWFLLPTPIGVSVKATLPAAPWGGGGLCLGHCRPCVCVSVSLSRVGEPRPLISVNTAILSCDWQTFSGQKCSKSRCLRGLTVSRLGPGSSLSVVCARRFHGGVYRVQSQLIGPDSTAGFRDRRLSPRKQTLMLNSHKRALTTRTLSYRGILRLPVATHPCRVLLRRQ